MSNFSFIVKKRIAQHFLRCIGWKEIGILLIDLFLVVCILIFVLFIALTILEWRIHLLWLNFLFLISGLAMAACVYRFSLILFNLPDHLRTLIAALILLLPYGFYRFPAVVVMILLVITIAFLILIHLLSQATRRFSLRGGRATASILFLLSLFLLVGPLANGMLDHSYFSQFYLIPEPAEIPCRLRPNRTYEINKDGYRGPLKNLSGPDGRPRILFLGDSSTFGVGLPFAKTFPSFVEQKLKLQGFSDVSVVNGGVPGYNIRNIQIRYRDFLSWRPDFVFVMAGYHFQTLDRDRSKSARVPKFFMRCRTPVRGIIWFSLLLIHPLQSKPIFPKEIYADWWIREMQILTDEITRHAGCPVLLVYPSDRIDKKIVSLQSRMAREKKIELIDLQASFKQAGSSLHFFDDLHPNEEGHRLMADIISAWLTERSAASQEPL